MAKNKESIIQNYDPVYYKNNEFGKVGFPFEVIKANKEAYARVFSEGSAALEKLLLHLWNNDIETFACCVGHGYIPSYTKDTLFGPKVIDKEEYFAHARSLRYHFYFNEIRPYFVFIMPVELEALRDLKDKINEHLLREYPQFPGHVSYKYDGHIGIHLNHCLSKNEVERFFTAVSEALTKVLGLEHSKEKEVEASFPVDCVGDLIAKAAAESVRNQSLDGDFYKASVDRVLDF